MLSATLEWLHGSHHVLELYLESFKVFKRVSEQVLQLTYVVAQLLHEFFSTAVLLQAWRLLLQPCHILLQERTPVELSRLHHVLNVVAKLLIGLIFKVLVLVLHLVVLGALNFQLWHLHLDFLDIGVTLAFQEVDLLQQRHHLCLMMHVTVKLSRVIALLFVFG